MTTDFCEHLQQYGGAYTEAETAYQSCLDLMDQVLASGPEAEVVEELQISLGEWELQTRRLRSTFVSLSKNGSVLLPRTGQNPNPVCGHCGLEVPRLEFTEFKFQDDGSVLFRGQELRAAEPVPA